MDVQAEAYSHCVCNLTSFTLEDGWINLFSMWTISLSVMTGIFWKINVCFGVKCPVNFTFRNVISSLYGVQTLL